MRTFLSFIILLTISNFGFSENATSGIDRSYDSRRLATTVSMYSHLEDGTGEFGIQSRAPFDASMTIPLGFSTLIETDTGLPYKISIADLEGANLQEGTIYLVDHQLNTVTNLSEGGHEFFSIARVFNERFTLQFESDIVLNTSEKLLDGVSIYPNPSGAWLRFHLQWSRLIRLKYGMYWVV